MLVTLRKMVARPARTLAPWRFPILRVEAGAPRYYLLFGFGRLIFRREVAVFFEVLGFDRFGDGVLAAEPFAQVNELATMRTKRPVLAREPIAGLFAGRAFDFGHL